MRAFLDRGAGPTALIFPVLCCVVLAAPAGAQALSLAEAQRIALERDAGLVAIAAEADALRHAAVAAGQLPDPEARLGAVNVPTDTFALDADEMTMLEVGVMQRFPAGRSRSLGRAVLDTRARGADAEAAGRARSVRWAVEQAWRELDYLDETLRLLVEQQRWAAALVAAAESTYAAGEGEQQDLLDARLMTLEVEERVLDAERERDAMRSELARWVGPESLQERIPAGPVGPAPDDVDALLAGLENHPELAALEAVRGTAEAETTLAQQRYRPSFGVDVAYGFRRGRGMDGASRPDMLSAMLTFDVPLFTRDRQDRDVAAARAMARSADARREDTGRELAARLRSAYARAVRLADLQALYDDGLQRLSTGSIDAALASYRAGAGSLEAVIGAQRRQLTLHERSARVRTDHALALAEIRYLTGDER